MHVYSKQNNGMAALKIIVYRFRFTLTSLRSILQKTTIMDWISPIRKRTWFFSGVRKSAKLPDTQSTKTANTVRADDETPRLLIMMWMKLKVSIKKGDASPAVPLK